MLHILGQRKFGKLSSKWQTVQDAQLFRDISIAICCAITLSLILAVTMIPVISYKLKLLQKNDDKKIWKFQTPNFLKKVSLNFLYNFYKYLGWVLQTKKRAFFSVLGIILFTLIGIILLAPKLEYLPEGNTNGELYKYKTMYLDIP